MSVLDVIDGLEVSSNDQDLIALTSSASGGCPWTGRSMA